ncbi:MAG: sugar transferase [Clostridia bacterium]|nr:sugar transferase [Clostridia bacterium]
MMICKWKKIPEEMKTDEVYEYWKILRKRNFSLFWKRVFDIVFSFLMLILLSPLFLILAIAIKADSKGPVFYRQERVTQYGRRFRIHKFRTMYMDSDKGNQVTVSNDDRITKIGRKIRRLRLDETAQIFDIFLGTMTFVGTRPEVPKYVDQYTNEMKATLLLPAGVTSLASIKYKDEDELLENSENVDETYINDVLPGKMEYNLQALRKQGFWRDIGIMFKTVGAVLRR